MLRGFSTVDSEQAGCVQGGMCPWREERGTGEVLTVQHHRQRAGNGNGSCTGFSTVDSDLGTGGVWGSAPWTVNGNRSGMCGMVQYHGQRTCTGFGTMESRTVRGMGS